MSLIKIALLLFAFGLTGCQSNVLVSNCKAVVVQDDPKARWLCDKGWSDFWR